jgi:hypothetical protein
VNLAGDEGSVVKRLAGPLFKQGSSQRRVHVNRIGGVIADDMAIRQYSQRPNALPNMAAALSWSLTTARMVLKGILKASLLTGNTMADQGVAGVDLGQWQCDVAVSKQLAGAVGLPSAARA